MADVELSGSTITLIIVAVIMLIVGLASFTIIDAGERGVVFSKVSGVKPTVMGEGFNFKTPFVDSVIPIDIKTQKVERQLGSTTLDQQVANVKIAVNFRVDETSVNKLYQEVGLNYVDKIVYPSIDDSVKTAMAQFKATELLEKRDLVSIKILEILRDKLNGRDVVVEQSNIINIDFSDEYNKAIEAKVTAEQQSFKAQNDLKRIEIEAKQKVTQARADADSQVLLANATATAKLLNARAEAQATIVKGNAEAQALDVQNKALLNSDKVLELRRIEKWDGTVPMTMLSGSEQLMVSVK